MYCNVIKQAYLWAGIFIALYASTALAGPFAPAAGQPSSTAIADTDASIVAWATGYENYLFGANVSISFQTPIEALGPSDAVNDIGNDDENDPFSIVSLGDSGSITLTFNSPITNGAGYDFVVFENGFSDGFLELAFVEVSSDGVNFVRFPTISLTPNAIGSTASMNPTNLFQFASKYRVGFGTPFDLSAVDGMSGLVDVSLITHVRITDIVGDGSVLDDASPISGGPHPIYDPYPTGSISAGFDLDAVGVINQIEPATEVNVPFTASFLYILAGLLVFARLSTARQKAKKLTTHSRNL